MKGTNMIHRDQNKIPKPQSNPASGLIEDTIAYHGISQAKAAKAMKITPQLLNNVIKGHKAISNELAIRFSICFDIPADLIIRLQSTYDYQIAYHEKQKILENEVEKIA